ncbi:MAG: hypothetical protein GY935_02860 [Gammaproteobacteria bacterium]|nr:hypothetical protein [Gammaproteobacteria bacterium]
MQLLAGWGRTYKPILYDELQPDIAVFGASWARDAFDPIETGELLGGRVFNHAVSGGTTYETRRFADSAPDNENLEAVIINLNTFLPKKNWRSLQIRLRRVDSRCRCRSQPQSLRGFAPGLFVGVRRLGRGCEFKTDLDDPSPRCRYRQT